MISTDFAPNESWDDAWLSFKLLFQPWRWKRGEETEIIKKELIKLFLSSKYHIGDGRTEMVQLFLTGRAALFELLKSLRLSKDYEVIVQAFTCEAVVLPILANNLKPVYVDIEAETFSMNFADLTKKLTNSSKVLILQHTFGLTPKYRERILRLANKHELIVVEDLAHGFNPSVFKTMNYELSTTNYFLLSFGRSKALSSVFGGAIISSNNETMEQWNNLPYPSYFFIFKCLLYKPLTMLIKFTYNFGFGKILHKVLINLNLLIPEITSKEKNGEFDELLNKAYPNGLNILLLHQLKKFDQILKHRVKICAYYSGHIQKTTNHQLSTINSSVIRYPLLVNNRDEILEKLRLQDIFLGKWYDQVVAPKKIDLKRVGYKLGSCPVAEEVCKKIINLPTNISETEAKKVINILNDVMTIQEIVKKSTWQRFFEKNGSPSFLQSWEWGEFEKRMGYKVTRLGIYLKNELVGMAQVIHMKTRRGNFLFIPHGPILTISNFKFQISNKSIITKLLNYLTTLAMELNCSFIRIAPILENTSKNQKIFSDLGFKKAPIYMHAERVWILPLNKSEDQLLSEMRKTTRYLIRKAERDGVAIEKRTNEKAVKNFYQIYLETAKRENFVAFSKEFIRQEFESFNKTRNAVFFEAVHLKGVLASALIIFTKSTAFYHQGASIHSKIPATYLLQWEAIKEAKKRGCKFYNFWGTLQEGRTPKSWSGLTLFKQGFGGYQVDYLPTQDLILSPKYYLTYFYEKFLAWRRGV